ncbi:hypothetical protein C8R45DRAFT_980448 [Mycena sanguinolenta]|nr:hypothetical protein C8R45DRAFT_980448 [Mycena sanguinolenta]
MTSTATISLVASIGTVTELSGSPTSFGVPVTTVLETPSGPRPPSNQPPSQNSGLSTTALAGLCLGFGLLVGLVVCTLIYVTRRRRAANKARIQRPRDWPDKPRDDEALLGLRTQEKQPWREFPGPQPVAVPPVHTRVTEWVQRTRAISIFSIPSSFVPPMSDSDSESTVHRSASTVKRSQSMASSRSAYSQASAARSEDRPVEAALSRPPLLDSISE